MFTRVVRATLLPAAVLFAAAFPSAAAAGPIDDISAVNRAAGDAVRPAAPLLQAPSGIVNLLPPSPRQALIDVTSRLSSRLGYRQDVAARITLANPPNWLAGRLANALHALLACHDITTAHYNAIKDRIAEVAKDGDGLDPAQFSDIVTCAKNLWTATHDLELSIRTSSASTTSPVGEIDIWPVLRVAGGTNSVYQNDYLMQLDFGGSDTYMNNVGSNMVDPNFSPAGSLVVGVRGVGPSRGCQMAIGTPGVGGLTNGDCIPTAAVLLDMQGSDTYGVKQSPDIDKQCTTAPVIRRMVTGGVGFLGVGILLDSGSSSDVYTGKTVTLGAGHVFGVGVLDDRGGTDRYSAVRNAQGFSLIEAFGLLHDEGGRDRFEFYLPPGGVIDDEGVCDADLRFLQGAGNVTGTGLLLEDGGDDTYVGGFSADFTAPGDPVTTGRGGSQGFGNNGGTGILFDRGAGTDSYTINGNQGTPARADNTTIGPDPTCQNSTCSGGVFIDR